jgi:hypothetical protein
MTKEIVANWEANKEAIRAELSKAPSFYWEDIVSIVWKYVRPGLYPDGITEVPLVAALRDGEHSGTLAAILLSKPYTTQFYYVALEYGSCSGCDTLEEALHVNDREKRLDALMTLALHIVQRIRKLPSWGEENPEDVIEEYKNDYIDEKGKVTNLEAEVRKLKTAYNDLMNRSAAEISGLKDEVIRERNRR